MFWDLADMLSTTDEAVALRRLDHLRELSDLTHRAAQRDQALARLEMALRARHEPPA